MTDYTIQEDMYCSGIINCKYQDENGKCVFNYLGSGREIDKPCYDITDEQRLDAIEEAIDKLTKNVIVLSKIVERIVGQ